MRNSKVLYGSFILSIFAIVLFGTAVQTNAVVITTLPFKDEGSFTGFTYNAVSDVVDTKFNALTELSKEYNMPIAALKYERNKMAVDLAGTNVLSDVEGVRDYINPVIANNTWNTAILSESVSAAVDSTFTTPAASAKDTELSFSSTTSVNVSDHSSVTTITSMTDLAEDLDGDGVFDETGLGEKQFWRSIDGNTMLYFNVEAMDMTANTGNASIKYGFERSDSNNDYNVTIVLHTESGDTGWTGLTSSADNGATWHFYDVVTGVVLSQMIPMDELLTDDLGDSPSIQGLDFIEMSLITMANDTTDMEIKVGNFAFFPQGELVAITDGDDGDDDFDFNDANGIPANSQDDTDLLITVVVEGATETYDSTVDLESSILDGEILDTEFRKIRFSGTATLNPTDIDVVSVTATGGFEVTATFVLRTTELKDITTIARRPTWTNLFHNMTVENDFLADTSDPDLNFNIYDIDDVDELDSFGSVWIGVDDGDEIQFDIADPSSTDGAKQDITYSWTSTTEVTFVEVTEAEVAVVVEEIGGLQGAINGLIGFLEGLGDIGALLIGILGLLGARKVIQSRNDTP